jgi:hypothetical protein
VADESIDVDLSGTRIGGYELLKRFRALYQAVAPLWPAAAEREA